MLKSHGSGKDAFVAEAKDAYDRARLSAEEEIRLGKAVGFGHILDSFIAEHRVSSEFAGEEEPSTCVYPPEYKGPKPIRKQIRAIAAIFNLDPVPAYKFCENLPKLELFVPSVALPWVGWFAFPFLRALTPKLFPEVAKQSKRHCRAIGLVHKDLSSLRKFHNYYAKEMDGRHLRVRPRTAEALRLIYQMQGNSDILVVAAQLGMCHRGRSARRAEAVMRTNEFGLDGLAIGSILLTHPERAQHQTELDMCCTGEEFSVDANDNRNFVPFYAFIDVGLKYGVNLRDHHDPHLGQVTAYIPHK
jgi:hypothetical protein